ncbi:AAA family ATPase [Viscerimonas tarda]
MITKLKIEYFKSHCSTNLSTGALTVLTGMNSSGKSSVLQALLLLRQSFKKGRLSTGLDLNAPLCDIGKGRDALYRFANESEIITFSLEVNNETNYNFHFNARNRYEDTFLPQENPMIFEPSLLQLALFTNKFQYLSSARWANINLYPMDTYAVETEKQLSLNYGQGELVAHFLEYYGENRNFDIQSDLVLHPSSLSKKLLAQTIAWEREISPRITMNPERIADKVTIEYGYKGVGENLPTNNLQPKNIGFGISYSLSIVVALLSAEQGSLLLIENPEAHLHPRGQSKLAELITLAAQSGVQIILETHSDHIFNGIRRAIAANKIEKEKVKIHFLELDEKNASTGTEIRLSNSGRVLNSKKGLFDQFDDDLDILLGL